MFCMDPATSGNNGDALRTPFGAVRTTHSTMERVGDGVATGVIMCLVNNSCQVASPVRFSAHSSTAGNFAVACGTCRSRVPMVGNTILIAN